MYYRMVAQIYRVQEPTVDEITTRLNPTLRSLFEAYEGPGLSQRQRNEMLIGMSVRHHDVQADCMKIVM